MTTTADFIMESAIAAGIRTVFTVPGGHAMYLNEAADFHPHLEVVHVHHEQTAAVAAEAYFHASKRPAMVLVTAGPGVMNALSGVAAAYLDAVPMLVISGQVKRDDIMTTDRPSFAPVLPTTSMVLDITCYAATVYDAKFVEYEFSLARTAMVDGPVWLDVPLDVQASEL